MIAIAFVVDSSASLASEWSSIVQGYIMHMLRRLQEANGKVNFRAAFVTYGTQGSPIVCKNFFNDLITVMTAFREDTSKLGMGQTSCGGDTGMAALEGFVAALELFDMFRESVQSKNLPYPPVYHIFHVAAAMPDNSERPQCNVSPILDSVTWDSLPSELKKRNINLSTINTRPKLPRFSELHSTCSPSVLAPWFAVRPQHTVLLSGYALVQRGVKRAGEPIATDRTPEPKRTKVSPPNTASPKTTQTSPPRAQTPVSAATPTPSAPIGTATPSAPPSTSNPMIPPTSASTPATAVPVNVPPITPQHMQQFQNAFRMAEQQVGALQSAIVDARNKGDTQLVETLMTQWTEKHSIYLKLKAALQHMHRAALAHAQQGQVLQTLASQAGAPQLPLAPQAQGQQVQAQGLGTGQGQPVPMMQPGLIKQDDGDTQMSAAESSTNTGTTSSQSLPAPGNSEPSAHMRSLSSGQGQPRNLNINPAAMAASPMMAQQIQKMVEQERSRQNTATTKPNSVQVWQGSMTWLGTNPAREPRTVSSFVIANSVNSEACGAETWPTSLSLTFAEQPAVSLRDLHLWMKRHQPAVCTFAANPRAENQAHNELAYKTLVAMLISKKLYFVASWVLPNGRHSNNVLLFPIHNAGLVGAFFPLTGIPEMPQSQELPGNPGIIPNPSVTPVNPLDPQPNPPLPPQMNAANAQQLMMQINNHMRSQGVALPPAFLAQLAKMNPAARNAAMQKVIRTGEEQRRQRAAAAAAAGGAPNRLGVPNSNIAGQGQSTGAPQLGMLQQQQQHQQHQLSQQSDMGGFNPAQFGIGGAAIASGGGMNGGMGSGYQDIMTGAGLPRTASNGGAVSFEMMQSFMHRNQESGNSNVGG